jgi:uncharacterized protein YcaQ
MPALTYERILAHRAVTYRLQPGQQLRSRDEAVDYVDERGFIYFWPIKDVTMPALWTAVAGDRPVADAHDDPGHVTWGWKDQLLPQRRVYYAKVLRRRATMISLAVAPHFYALSENYGEPEHDYLEQYKAGSLSHEAKTVYEVLLQSGPLDTPELRRQARMTARSSDTAFNRAIESLQADFKVLPVGVAEVGRWKYAFLYECVHRWYPDLPQSARAIRRSEARAWLLSLYLHSTGAARAREVDRVFGWARDDMEAAQAALVREVAVVRGVSVEGHGDDWLALASLVAKAQ